MDEENKVINSEDISSDTTIDMKEFLENEEAMLKDEQATLAQAKRNSKESKIKIILTVIVVFAGSILGSAYAIGSKYDRSKTRRYEAAQMLQEKGMYQDAIDVYDDLYGYENSDELISECETLKAEAGTKTTYDNALKKYNNGDYLAAATLFTKVSAYEDAKDKAAECYYKYGLDCVEESDFENAYLAFTKAGDFEDATALANFYKFSVLTVGDTYIFGKYEQDGDLTNGAEDLEWVVLNMEEDTALLVSKYILEAMEFNYDENANSSQTVSYADSSIRTFVNDTFYNEAFTQDEKSLILPLTITETDNSNNVLATSDNYVFLPTYEMFRQYMTNSSIELYDMTDAAYAQTETSTSGIWWTSTVNSTGNKAYTAYNTDSTTLKAFTTISGVRVAIYVNFANE